MKNLFTIALIAFFAEQSYSAQAWSYIGIPYPTDDVPTAIMPTLPSGPTAGSAWPYDPCTIENPVFNDGPNQYYVNSANGNDSTAGNSGRGSVANPRKTFPGSVSGNDFSLSAGMQVFVTDNSILWSTGSEEDRNIISGGTAANPCWIIGVDTDANVSTLPKFAMDKFFIDGEHLIIDGVEFERNGGMRIKFGHSGSGYNARFCTLRNSVVDGLGSAAKNAAIGGSGLDGNNRSEFIMIYNNTISELGDWDRQDSKGTDNHAIQMVSYTSHWWIIDNKIFHCEGDSVQVNTSGQSNADYDRRPHYIYIAGNHMYENYENAIDNKTCYHSIASENLIHSFYNDFKPANKTAFILANNSEGWLSSYQWAIFNTVYDSGTGIRSSADAAETVDDPLAAVPVQTSGHKNYIIGNLIYDCDYPIAIQGDGTSPNGAIERTWFEEIWVVGNTMHSRSGGVRLGSQNTAAGEPCQVNVIGNIVYNLGTDDEIDLGNSSTVTNTVNYNVIYRSNGSTSMKTNDFHINTGNMIDQNPIFSGLASYDFTLQSGSPAIIMPGLSTTPAPYITFETMYGIDISVDITGKERPNGSSWSAGAYQGEVDISVPPPPTSLTVSGN